MVVMALKIAGSRAARQPHVIYHFNHKEHELLIGHLLHGLWSRPVDLTAKPRILGVGVNAQLNRFVGDARLGWIDGCYGP